MAKIVVPELDAHGVVVDQDRSGSISGQLTKAQNAIADPLGEKGSIRKRPGLKAINGTAGTGTVRGGVGVPRLLGSAGPDIANPFTDITVTITQYTTPTVGTGGVSSTGYVQRLGTTFNDESFYYFWDWNEDFAEINPNDIYGDVDDLYDVTGDGNAILDVPNATVNTIVPVTFFGDVTGFWYVALDTALAQDTDTATTYTNTQTLVFPTGSVRAYNASGAGTGGSSDANYPLTIWFSGGQAEDGYPTCVLNNVLYYVGGYDDYTVDTNAPPLRAYNGYDDRVVAIMPKNLDVSATAHPKAIVSLLAANGKVYISTLDGGANGAAGGTIRGSVYEFNPATQRLAKLGASFPTGYLPYSLAWAYGRLWCGASVNRNGDATAARVYYFRPGIDTAWTLDETFAANEGICMALEVFQGRLFAALNFNSDAGGTARVMIRATTGTWSASDTGTVPAAASNYDNGYMSLLVWPPENGSVTSPTSALFATRRAITGDAGTGAVRKFDGTSWSTVHTYDYDASGAGHLESTYTINSSNTPVPTIWVARGSTVFPNSTNGTSWTNRWSTLTSGAQTVSVTAGFGGVILQLAR